MSDRRPEKVKLSAWYRHEGGGVTAREPTSDEVLAFVRAGVESGTIKGKLAETEDCVSGHRGHSSLEIHDLSPGTYLVIGPVSDGGSET